MFPLMIDRYIHHTVTQSVTLGVDVGVYCWWQWWWCRAVAMATD